MKTQPLCLTVLVSLVGLSCLAGPSLALTQPEPFLQLHQYFEEPLKPRSSADLTRAQAYIQEGRYQHAHDLLEPLNTAYPTESRVALLLGETHLGLGETADAQAFFHKAELLANHHDPDEFTQARLGQVRTYLHAKNHQAALKLLGQLQPEELAAADRYREQYHYFSALAYQQQQDYATTYDHLQFAILNGVDATPSRSLIHQHKSLFAQAKYHQALKAFSTENYRQAFAAIRESLHLMPNNPTYINAQSKMHENFVKVLKIHSEKARIVAIPILRDIRFYLETENYPQAYKSYMKLISQENVAFFVRNDYLYYLPKNMGERIKAVDSVLRLQGLNPPTLGT